MRTILPLCTVDGADAGAGGGIPDHTGLRWKTPFLLIYEKKLSALNELLPLPEAVVQTRQATVGHCGGRRRGRGARRRAMLEDIAILTGGTMVSTDLGIKLEKVTTDMLGRTKKVIR